MPMSMAVMTTWSVLTPRAILIAKRPSRRPNKCDKYAKELRTGGALSSGCETHMASRGDAPTQLRRRSQDTQSENDSEAKGAEMPDDSKPDQSQSYEDNLRNFILLTLPWLSYQREMLEIAKRNITDPSRVRSTENFTLRQLQALMMILDRSGTRRNLLDEDFKKRLEVAFKELFPKLTSARVQLIEAQEEILTTMFDTLNTLRKGDKPKSD
jgi:hypothetical protein